MAQDVTLQLDTSNISGGNTKIDRTDFLTPFSDVVSIINDILNGVQPADMINFNPGVTNTIVAGAITVAQAINVVAAETGTADDLSTVTMSDGDMCVLVADTGDTITLKHGTGNLSTFGGTDLEIDSTKAAMLWKIGTTVFVIGGGGGSSALTTKGDLAGYDTADARVPVGSDGQTLIAASDDAQGVAYENPDYLMSIGVGRKKLSSSTSGKGIKVTGTSTGTSVTAHAVGASAERVWIYAYNGHSSPVNLTLEWGGTTAPNDTLVIPIPNGAGLFLAVDGLLLQGSLSITAFAGTANVITLYGFATSASSNTIKLSGSTDGRPILVAATSTPGTAIHTAHATLLDEVWLYAVNTDTAAITLTIEFGGTAVPDNVVAMSIPPAAGTILVIPGMALTGSLSIAAFAGTTNKIIIAGYANRMRA